MSQELPVIGPDPPRVICVLKRPGGEKEGETRAHLDPSEEENRRGRMPVGAATLPLHEHKLGLEGGWGGGQFPKTPLAKAFQYLNPLLEMAVDSSRSAYIQRKAAL